MCIAKSKHIPSVNIAVIMEKVAYLNYSNDFGMPSF